jgi:prepilin-type N-terminal cleavage/methylation domain-containing protein/prepilin-type processing-associated H-X9-DG protein
MFTRSRRAFTLIELLVVIAIIAILAAILFPVFAQARQSARAAASISNNKQIALAVLMYNQDYDEAFPEYINWGDPSLSPIYVGGIDFGLWTYAIEPYLKNVQVYADPACGLPVPPTGYSPSNVWSPIFTQYGYDYTVLAPMTGTIKSAAGYWVGVAAHNSDLARPSDTVMISSRFAWQEPSSPSLWWYGAGTITTLGGAEAPDCNDIPPYCWTDWAPNGNYSCCPDLTTLVDGMYTGGDSLRKQGNMNLSFCDGHVKYMPPGQAASGSSWYQGVLSGNVHITTPTLYHWEQSP